MIKRRVKGRIGYVAVLDRIGYFEGHSFFRAVLQESVPNERTLRNGAIVRFSLKAWKCAKQPKCGMRVRLKRLVLFGYGWRANLVEMETDESRQQDVAPTVSRVEHVHASS